MKRYLRTLPNTTTVVSKFYKDPLASYMAGLLESDGNITINKEDKNGNVYTRLKFTFNKDDAPFVEFLQKKFNRGKIYYRKTHAVNWEIRAQEDVLNMLIFINGHLRTAKIITLQKAFNFFRENYGMDITCLPLDNTPFLSNAWLAGFSEGDSSFLVECSNKEKKVTIKPTYSLQVAENYILQDSSYDIYRDNRIFMQPLSDLFEDKLIKRIRPARLDEGFKETHSLTLQLRRHAQISSLINYFSIFPLYSTKYLNYLSFKTIFELKMDAKTNNIKLKHIYPKVLEIKNSMNSKRINSSITWDHLGNFYKIPNDFPSYKIYF